MRALHGCLLVAAFSSHASAQIDCWQRPLPLAERLVPDMNVFIGQAISREPARGVTPVRFHVEEWLWGEPPAHDVTIPFGFFPDQGFDGLDQPSLIGWQAGARFRECDRGFFAIPAHDPSVELIRRWVRDRTPATMSVLIRSSYSPVAGVQVTWRGNGRSIAALSDMKDLALGTVAPGTYQVTAVHPHFRQSSPRTISVVPGSRATAVIELESRSRVSGRIVNSRGEPVHGRIFLSGKARIRKPAAMGSEALESVLSWFGFDQRPEVWENQGPLATRTAADGQFEFSNVYPGRYYLRMDSSVDDREGIPLPELFYPGVFGWKAATPIVVEDGESVRDVRFQLPDLGPKRRLTVRVFSEDGLPVQGVSVMNRRLPPANQRAARALAKLTDTQGVAVLELWPGCDYVLSVQFSQGSKDFSGHHIDISAGGGDIWRDVVLTGYRQRKEP